ncbi:hypothetical protein NQZ68_006149 [Dissostichus eleginoides]|nr:hypothetical protein NQZ68_006149 [Dissostichus eleginoides]
MEATAPVEADLKLVREQDQYHQEQIERMIGIPGISLNPSCWVRTPSDSVEVGDQWVAPARAIGGRSATDPRLSWFPQLGERALPLSSHTDPHIYNPPTPPPPLRLPQALGPGLDLSITSASPPSTCSTVPPVQRKGGMEGGGEEGAGEEASALLPQSGDCWNTDRSICHPLPHTLTCCPRARLFLSHSPFDLSCGTPVHSPNMLKGCQQ